MVRLPVVDALPVPHLATLPGPVHVCEPVGLPLLLLHGHGPVASGPPVYALAEQVPVAMDRSRS
jgi:hypothetical protein